ncbi:MAG TPA: RICIN domain-containing protein, partial [Trebonia sp.]|nr:RICIN domain-containing protein [Trebonia sp.]
YGTLGDLLTDTGGLPNGAWWLYKWYGDMTGEMVDTTPPAQTGIDGAAAVSPARNLVSVIFGNGSGAAQVTINGLGDLPAFGATAHVVLQTVTSPGRTTPVSAPTTIFDGDLPVTGGTVTVPVAAMNPAYGYHILVSPAGHSAPGLDGTYRITARNGQALTISGASPWPGAPATTAQPSKAQVQLWSLVGTGTGYYKVVNDADGLLLGASPSAPAAVVQLRDDGSAASLWRVTPGPSGATLVNKATGQALTLTGPGVALRGRTGSDPVQRWALTPATLVNPGVSYTITNLNSALNLDTPGGSAAPGAIADQENPNGAADQQWQFVPSGNGLYTIVNKGSGLLLGIQGQSTAEGANAVLEPADNLTDQLWQLVPNGTGAYWLGNEGSGLLLGVSGADTTPGTLTLQWADNGTPDHLWTIAAS